MFFRYPIFLAAIWLFLSSIRIWAHQGDMYNADRVLEVRLGDGFVDLQVMMGLKEFPSLAERMKMDRNKDGWIEEEEARFYTDIILNSVLENISIAADGKSLELKSLGQKIDLYEKARVVPEHHDLTLDFSTKVVLPEGKNKSCLFKIKDRFDWPYPGKIIFALIVDRKLEVDSTSLDPWPQTVEPERLKEIWVSCRRRDIARINEAAGKGEGLWRIIKFAQADNRPEFAVAGSKSTEADYSPAPVSNISAGSIFQKEESGFNTRLKKYLQSGEKSAARLWLLLAAAFLYGCIHALAPGHAKTVTAAYLVGSRHSWPYAFLLAFTVTLTHTGSILILALITKLAYGEGLSLTAQAVLGGFSGLIVLVLGIQRLRSSRGNSHLHHGQIQLPGEHHHHDEHKYEQGVHPHEEPGKEEMERGSESKAQVLWLGFAGGLMPCPGALWIYFLALGFGHPGLAMVLILALSMGLALVLVAVGLATISLRDMMAREAGKRKTGPAAGSDILSRLHSLADKTMKIAPALAGTALVILGSFLLWRSLAELGLR